MKNIEVLSDVYMTSLLHVCTCATRVCRSTGGWREGVCPRVAPAGDRTRGAGKQGQERVYKRGDGIGKHTFIKPQFLMQPSGTLAYGS